MLTPRRAKIPVLIPLAIVLMLLGNLIWANTLPTTPLKSISYSDQELMRLRDEIKANLRHIETGELEHPLRLMSYRVKESDNFFTIMARTSQNADTLASLNNIVNPEAITPGDQLLIPNARGIFIEQKKAIKRENSRRYPVPALPGEKRKELVFLPGQKFEKSRLRFFLGHEFTHPLPQGRLSSSFGMRRDPINKRATFHGGIDIAAPQGTPVRASQNGKVTFAGKKGGYGKLIIVQHNYGYETYYGHLSSIKVRKGERVRAGQAIGLVGKTGRTTGPHLHFEVRRKGVRNRPRFAYHKK